MTDYYPHSWVVLKARNEEETLYKVLGGWSGGYLDGDSWRFNSGIVRVVEENESIEFYGRSGSCYVCRKDSYGLSMAIAGVYNQLKETFGDNVEMMPEDTDWMNVEWQL